MMLHALRPALLALVALPFCNIPVFRYALERWSPSVYELVVFHRGPLGEAERAVIDRVRDLNVNVQIDRVDLAGGVDPRWRPLLNSVKRDPPFAALLFPGGESIAWAGPLEPEALAKVLDSPARRETARRLMAGDSTVWLFLPSGKAEEDAAARGRLAASLKELETSLKLPPRLPSDPPLLSDAPVRISFPILDVRRDDPAEAVFADMLLRSEADLRGPVVFPVFGRGRALWALAGEGLHPETIREAAAFLIGACSCEAKELNPGLDLVFQIDWESGLREPPEGDASSPPPPVLLKPYRPPPATPELQDAAEPGFSCSWTALLALAAAGLLVVFTGLRLLKGGTG